MKQMTAILSLVLMTLSVFSANAAEGKVELEKYWQFDNTAKCEFGIKGPLGTYETEPFEASIIREYSDTEGPKFSFIKSFVYKNYSLEMSVKYLASTAVAYTDFIIRRKQPSGKWSIVASGHDQKTVHDAFAAGGSSGKQGMFFFQVWTGIAENLNYASNPLVITSTDELEMKQNDLNITSASAFCSLPVAAKP